MKCNISKQCGSCQYIDMDYQSQLKLKQENIQKLFPYKQVHIPIGMDNPYGYRNKVIVAFNQKYEYGLYEENSHRIIPFYTCLLHDNETNHILKVIQTLFRENHYSIYDKNKNRGLIRHVLIRRAVKTNQTLVVLVCNNKVFPGSKKFCQMLVKSCPSVKSVVMNINQRNTSIVLGNKENILYGKGFVVDELCGLTYKISASSFYQINHEQCEKLYHKAIELLNPKKNDIVLDTYCGIGTIGMSLAHQVSKVIGVEMNKQAYYDAMNNAKMNHLSNIHFYNEDATLFMQKHINDHIDAIIMDPPRSGSTPEFIQAACVMKPRVIVYISCDPSTQARDLKIFQKYHYDTKEVYLFDMFPHTKHTESILLLKKNITGE